jgi:hypothetical protein
MSLYSSSKKGGLSLKFGVGPATAGASPSWTWLDSGPADTRRSPEADESNRNHCVFLRGFTISKRGHKLWSKRKEGQLDIDILDLTGQSLSQLERNNSGSGNTTGTSLTPTYSQSSVSGSGCQHVDSVDDAASGQLSQHVDRDNINLKTMGSPPNSTEDQYAGDRIIVELLTEMSNVSASYSLVAAMVELGFQSNHPSEIINQCLLHDVNLY